MSFPQVMARSNNTLDPAGTSQALQSLASLALPVTPLMLLKKCDCRTLFFNVMCLYFHIILVFVDFETQI